MSVFKQILIACFIFILFSSTGFSQSTGVAERFSEFDPNSTVHINHKPLSDILKETVLPVGRSYKILGNESPDSYRGSRIKVSKSLSPSRFEGNRVFFMPSQMPIKIFFRPTRRGLSVYQTESLYRVSTKTSS